MEGEYDSTSNSLLSSESKLSELEKELSKHEEEISALNRYFLTIIIVGKIRNFRRQQLLEGDNKQSDEKVKGSEIQLHFVIFRLYSSLACFNCSPIGNDKQEC